jgi:hypothetical protein
MLARAASGEGCASADSPASSLSSAVARCNSQEQRGTIVQVRRLQGASPGGGSAPKRSRKGGAPVCSDGTGHQ